MHSQTDAPTLWVIAVVERGAFVGAGTHGRGMCRKAWGAGCDWSYKAHYAAELRSMSAIQALITPANGMLFGRIMRACAGGAGWLWAARNFFRGVQLVGAELPSKF